MSLRHVSLILAAILIWPAVMGCDEDVTAPVDILDPPAGLGFVNGDAQITLDWEMSPDAAMSTFAGYNVYRSTSSMIDTPDADLDTLKQNQVPTTATSFFDASVENGTRYYYAVRSVRTDGTLSVSSQEVNTAPRPQGGVVSLAEFADPARPSGFDLSEGRAYLLSSSNPDNRIHIDLYLGTLGVQDEPADTLTLKSPNLILGSDSAWSSRIAGLKLLADRDVSMTSNAGWQDSIVLGGGSAEIEGKVIAVRTPPDENGEVHFGKIEILSTDGTQGTRKIDIVWAYQPIPNYIRF